MQEQAHSEFHLRPAPLASRRLALCLAGALLATLLAGCTRLNRLTLDPLSDEQSVTGYPGASATVQVPRLLAIPRDRMAALVPDLLAHSARWSVLRRPDSQILLGFPEDSETPADLVLAFLLGSRRGHMPVLVAVRASEGQLRIENVLTLDPVGYVKGHDVFQKKQKKFISQFLGRDKLPRKVDAISGATPIWRPLARQLGWTLKELRRTVDDAALLEQLSTTAHPVPSLSSALADAANDTGRETEPLVAARTEFDPQQWETAYQVRDDSLSRKAVWVIGGIEIGAILVTIAVSLAVNLRKRG